MPNITPRLITEIEAAVIEAVMERAAVGPSLKVEPDKIRQLIVRSTCPCGCPTIGFLSEEEQSPGDVTLVADGMVPLPDDHYIGVLVYSSKSRGLVELEICWSHDAPAPMPLPSEIGPGPNSN